MPMNAFDPANVVITFRGISFPTSALTLSLDPDPVDVLHYGPWTATMTFRYTPARRWKRGQKRTARDRRRERRNGA